MARAASGMRLSGAMIRRMIHHSPAPSTRAASMYESGILRIHWRRRKIPKVEAGVEVDDDLIRLRGFDQSFAKAEALRMLSTSARPTAVLTGGIGTTVGMLQAIRHLRLRVGEDVAIVVLDEWPHFDVLTKGFASVSRDSGEMGAAAAGLLHDLLKGEPARTVTIDTSLHPALGTQLMVAETL